MTADWIIEQQKAVGRGSLELNTQPVLKWQPQLAYGRHSSRLLAMRAYIETGDPGFRGFPDELIRRHWRSISRSSGLRTARFAPAAAGES